MTDTPFYENLPEVKTRRVNDGYFVGARDKPLAEIEATPDFMELSPYEKGQFRRAYWAGRIHSMWDWHLAGCVRYMNLDTRARFHAKLDALYRATLIEMYGEEGAREFRAHVGDEP